MALSKMKIYFKLSIIGVFLTAMIIFILSNADGVTIKFLWYETPSVPKYIFIVIVAFLGGILFWMFRQIGHLIKDVRKLRKQK